MSAQLSLPEATSDVLFATVADDGRHYDTYVVTRQLPERPYEPALESTIIHTYAVVFDGIPIGYTIRQQWWHEDVASAREAHEWMLACAEGRFIHCPTCLGNAYVDGQPCRECDAGVVAWFLHGHVEGEA
jgi:hypothetical protein